MPREIFCNAKSCRIFFILKTNDIPVTPNQYFYIALSYEHPGVQRDFILERIHAKLKAVIP